MLHTELTGPNVRPASPDRMGDEPARSVASLSDDALLDRAATIVARSRSTEVALIRHLAEIDARRLYAREGCPSMFVYCTLRLRFSEAEAYLRITAARASREHPSLLIALADGRLHLSALARLAPHLTPDNLEWLVTRAAGRSKREVMELVAELTPKPDTRTTIRALPGTTVEAPGRPMPAAGASAAAPTLCPGRVSTASPGDAAPSPLLPASPVPNRPLAPPAAGVEPTAPGRYRVQFTADRPLRDKLDRLRDLLGLAEVDLAEAIDTAVTEALRRLEARRFAKAVAPRRTLLGTDTHAVSRHVPAAVRRAVYERDGGQCRFFDHRGRRCPARRELEFHHRHPYAFGGSHAVDNLQLMCRTHNRHVAEIDFGRSDRALATRSS